MGRRDWKGVEDLIIKFLLGEATLQEIAAYWMCGEKRVYQLIGSMSYKYTGNNRCRDGVLLAQMRLKHDMANRRPMEDNTPEAFYYYERNRPCHPDMV
jgi:hypothetical protein